MSKERILIIDDEVELCNLIKYFLEHEGFETFMRYDATSALEDMAHINPDIIILDIMLPDMSGVDLCLRIRNEVCCPIIFMSCKAEEIDKIIALSVGGDDYITKPFDSGELVARVKAHIRREQRNKSRFAEAEKGFIYECEGLVLDETKREVYLDGERLIFTAKGFDILNLLMKEPRRVFSKEQIFELVWKEEALGRSDNKTILVHMSGIRKKIEPEGRQIKYIHNIRSVGYKFNELVKCREV